MRFELFIAIRYLTATRKQTMVSVVSLIAIGGVTVGVMALVIALALMTGFSSDIQHKILGAEAHVFVYGDHLSGGITDWQEIATAAAAIPHVLGSAPNVLDTGILEGPLQRDRASMRGVLPDVERTITDVAEKITSGSFDDLLPYSPGERPGIILGKDLAYELGVAVGDVVRYLSLSQYTLSPIGPLPRRQPFQVVGLFETGHYEYDRSWALTHMTVAQHLLSLDGSATTVKFRVDNLDHIRQVTIAVRELFGERYIVRDLLTVYRELFAAFKLEKILIGITIGLIVAVAALNIVTTLTMMVMEKTRDIGIMMAMGATSPMINRIFRLQGLVVGVLGTVTGLVLGVSICWWLDTYEVIQLSTKVYFIPYIPFKVKFMETVIVGVAAVVVSFLATIYPSYRAARLDTASALRYE